MDIIYTYNIYIYIYISSISDRDRAVETFNGDAEVEGLTGDVKAERPYLVSSP